MPHHLLRWHGHCNTSRPAVPTKHSHGVCMEDEEQVVEEVRRQGGFEYVRLTERAAEGDDSAAEAAHDMAWEQLHSAPWHAVHDAWRDAYALSCLHLATHRAHDALRLLDMGLLMGGPLLKPRLHAAIAHVQQQQQHSILPHDSKRVDGTYGEDMVGDVDLHANVVADRRMLDTDGRCTLASDDGPKFSRVLFETESQLVAGKACTQPAEVPASKLPQGSLCHQAVMRKNLVSVEDFICGYFIPNVPVIISNAMTHWPAIDKWKNLNYFKDALGSRTIPVEVGEHYLAPGWKQELMTMDQLLRKLQSVDGCSSERPYLAQHPLFEQIPKLREDIIVPDYCAATGGELRAVNAWFGPSGTVTPLHHDPHHNLLSQVIGRKYVRLYSPAEGFGLYPFKESMLCNSSQVDLDSPDYIKFPLSEKLPFLDCILEEGDMLYIPPKWWHYVRSLSVSFSVSFWWSGSEE